MKIKTFKVEQWMNEFEERAAYNLGETCVYSITLKQLFGIAGVDEQSFYDEILNKRFTYGHIFGSDLLNSGISKLYKNISPSEVLPAHGAIGANHLVLYSLVEAGDSVVSVIPTYQQLYSIPESFGADVKLLKLRPENGYLPDMNELRSLVSEKTKIININNPNNPSGALMPEKMLKEIAGIAKSVDAYVLCDEVYRGLSQSDEYSVSIVELYDKGISVGSLSKVFSLAGLRMGWIAAHSEEVMNLCREHRDYNTISCGVFDDHVAAIALNNADKVMERSKAIVRTNLEILDKWVASEPKISYIKPQAGTTTLLNFNFNADSYEFCVRLIEEKGTLLTPGSCFELENCARIGYGCDTEELKAGLAKISELVKEY